jgi:hypothetical protein
MKDLFTFQNFPMAIIIGLVIFSWFALLTVLIAH